MRRKEKKCLRISAEQDGYKEAAEALNLKTLKNISSLFQHFYSLRRRGESSGGPSSGRDQWIFFILKKSLRREKREAERRREEKKRRCSNIKISRIVETLRSSFQTTRHREDPSLSNVRSILGFGHVSWGGKFGESFWHFCWLAFLCVRMLSKRTCIEFESIQIDLQHFLISCSDSQRQHQLNYVRMSMNKHDSLPLFHFSFPSRLWH